MTWNPSQTIEVNALKPDPYLAMRFVEHEVTTTDPRKGWAPPRKRPRRVYKKLAARGFAQRCNGPTLGTTQCKRWKSTARALNTWLYGVDPGGEGWDYEGIRVDLGALSFDGTQVRLAPEGAFKSHVLCVTRLQRLSITASHEPARVPRTSETYDTWRGHRVWVESLVYHRRIGAEGVVFVPDGVSPEHPLLSRVLEQSVHHVARAVLNAAGVMSNTTRIAAQTTYRPYKETAL